MASLFGKNRLRSIAERIKTEEISDYIAIVQTWHADYHTGTLRRDKETSREQAYNQDFLIKILGYREKPTAPFSLEPKATTDRGQLPDAVISHTDTSQGIKNIAAVVELKGAAIDLDRPQQRDGNMSPVQQAFKYKTQYRNCPFVIVSNFWEFRLYQDNLLDYESWTLDDLVDPADDFILFKTWYSLLNVSNFTTSKGFSNTESLLTDIRVEQEEIGKKFYKVYKNARLELLRDMYARNEHIKINIDLGIEKAQKIIDRIVFACFAEDRGLLPDDTLLRVVRSADNSVFGGSLWNTFKAFFEAIDVGSEKLEIPDGYNGGLFKYDDQLNNLRIGDDPLRSVASLGSYNFSEDLSVNILGHIFEQSISDLEEIKSKVNQANDLDSLNQNRRKKDGIFYTPDYIVRYIVERSLGGYLSDHEERFKRDAGLKDDITDKNYEKREKQAYTKYQDFLQNVKVLDPACGSGAFLVHVFDYLLAENKRVGDILGNSLFSSDEYVRDILRNNIYGVDLNEESVEITKLSLWLKSAQKGKKLTTLDGNIKCGNSLVDSMEVAGNKAFDWTSEFKSTFDNGGFDVVVGNPPYVNSKHIDQPDREYLWAKNLEVLQMDMDLYQIFLYQSIQSFLKPDGYLGFITPDSYLTGQSFKKLRQYVISNVHLLNLVDFPYRFFPFEDVNTETCVIIIKKEKLSSYEIAVNIIDKKQINNTSLNQHKPKILSTSKLNAEFTLNINIEPLTQKILDLRTDIVFKHIFKLSNRSSLDRRTRWPSTSMGIYDRCVFTEADITSDPELEDIVRPAILGDGILKYRIHGSKKFTNIVAANGKQINDQTMASLAQPKLVGQRITGQAKFRLAFAYDDSGLIPMPSVNTINSMSSKNQLYLKPLLCIVNSKLYNYTYKSVFGESNTNITSDVFELVPIPSDTFGNASSILTDLSDAITSSYTELTRTNERFRKLADSECLSVEWPARLTSWWKLDFAHFITGLGVSISIDTKERLLDLFDSYQTQCLKIEKDIKATDSKIDNIVYSLYGLSTEDIDIIEGSN